MSNPGWKPPSPRNVSSRPHAATNSAMSRGVRSFWENKTSEEGKQAVALGNMRNSHSGIRSSFSAISRGSRGTNFLSSNRKSSAGKPTPKPPTYEAPLPPSASPKSTPQIQSSKPKASKIDWDALSDEEDQAVPTPKSNIDWDALSDSDAEDAPMPSKSAGIDWNALSDSDDDLVILSPDQDGSSSEDEEQNRALQAMKERIWAALDEEYEDEIREMQEEATQQQKTAGKGKEKEKGVGSKKLKRKKERRKESSAGGGGGGVDGGGGSSTGERDRDEHGSESTGGSGVAGETQTTSDERRVLGQEVAGGQPYLPSYVLSYVFESWLAKARLKPIPTTLKQGYMLKIASGRRSGRFQRRWFVLTSTDLSYFLHFGDDEPRGSIRLSTVVSVQAVEGKKSNVFNIETSGKNYMCMADNISDQLDWIAQITAAAEEAKFYESSSPKKSNAIVVNVRVPSLHISKLVRLEGSMTPSEAREVIVSKFKNMALISPLLEKLYLYLAKYQKWLDEVVQPGSTIDSVLVNHGIIELKQRRDAPDPVTFHFFS